MDTEAELKIKCDNYKAVRKDGGSACCVNELELALKAEGSSEVE